LYAKIHYTKSIPSVPFIKKNNNIMTSKRKFETFLYYRGLAVYDRQLYVLSTS